MRVFSTSGYFVDDHSEFDDYLIAEFDDTPRGYSDDQIFFYGLSESDIQNAIASGEPVDDFVLTGYQEVFENREDLLNRYLDNKLNVRVEEQ